MSTPSPTDAAGRRSALAAAPTLPADARRTKLGGAKGSAPPEVQGGFFVVAHGQVESGQFHAHDSLFCRYTFAYGSDWKVVQGIDSGFSQVVSKGGSDSSSVVWNFPIEVTFKSTNPHGWPRLVVTVYSTDMFGRYVVRGYGSVLIPTVPGTYVRYVRMFAPVASTLLQSILSWVTGSMPEFYDSKFAAAGEGREVCRVRSSGVVKVQFSVLTRGMALHGFSTGGPPDVLDTEADAGGVAAGVHGALASTRGSGFASIVQSTMRTPSSSALGTTGGAAGASEAASTRARAVPSVLAATQRMMAASDAALSASRALNTRSTTAAPPAPISSTDASAAAAAASAQTGIGFRRPSVSSGAAGGEADGGAPERRDNSGDTTTTGGATGGAPSTSGTGAGDAGAAAVKRAPRVRTARAGMSAFQVDADAPAAAARSGGGGSDDAVTEVTSVDATAAAAAAAPRGVRDRSASARRGFGGNEAAAAASSDSKQ